MVDVSSKDATERAASAEAVIVLSEEAFDLVVSGTAKKGDVLATARIAGIMAAKKTSELIPLCHPLALSHAGVEFTPDVERHAFKIVASARTTGPTGVEMEALTAASVAALTIYDMVKAVDRGAVIESIKLLSTSAARAERSLSASSLLPHRAARSRRPARLRRTVLDGRGPAPKLGQSFKRARGVARIHAAKAAARDRVGEAGCHTRGTSSTDSSPAGRDTAGVTAEKLAKAGSVSVWMRCSLAKNER